MEDTEEILRAKGVELKMGRLGDLKIGRFEGLNLLEEPYRDPFPVLDHEGEELGSVSKAENDA